MFKLKDKAKSRLRIALIAGLFLSGIGGAVAGMWSQLPLATTVATSLAAATLPLTGNETGAFDTNLSGGRNPQTEQVSISQLKAYMFGNGGVSGAVANNVVVASGAGNDSRTVGAASCVGSTTLSASRCIVRASGLVTASNSTYTLTVSNADIISTSIILATMGFEANTPTGARLISAIPLLGAGQIGSAQFVVLNDAGATFSSAAMRMQFVVIN